MTVAGVDACRHGWIAVVLDRETTRGVFAPTLAELNERVGAVEGGGVDIPIGLPQAGRRAADVEARAVLGPRRSSVFHTPVRQALEAPTHAEASAISRELTGHGISQQAFALAPKIFETEVWVRDASTPVWEVHPEVSFTHLLGQPCAASKSTWAGMWERRDALEAAGIVLDDLGAAGAAAGIDDVLDAAVAAWSARRLVQGEAVSYPDPPAVDDETARAVAIWA